MKGERADRSVPAVVETGPLLSWVNVCVCVFLGGFDATPW